MGSGEGTIDARNSNINEVKQINIKEQFGPIHIPILPGDGQTTIEIVRRTADPIAVATDQLTPFGAPRNEAFVGRTKELDKLHRLLTDPRGPHTVVVTAGAGYGKTELVKQYAHVGPVGDDIGSIEPWHGRWWVDASNNGEQPSAIKLYKTLFGRDPPEQSPLDVIRREITTVLSCGRHLLVLDNAENVEQIKCWRLGGDSRVIATTRRQLIPTAVAAVVELDVLSSDDALTILEAGRDDLKTPASRAVLAGIAQDLGRHALAIAFAAAGLARVPHEDPVVVRQKITATDIGDPHNLLEEIDPMDLGTEYRLSLAQSLGLLLEDLADPAMAGVLTIAGHCHADTIPINLFRASMNIDPEAIDAAIRELHARAIITCGSAVSLHRLTQSMLRRRAWGSDRANTLRLLACLCCELGNGLVKHLHGKGLAERVCFASHAMQLAAHLDARRHILPPRDTVDLDQFDLAMLHRWLAEHLEDTGDQRAARADIDAAVAWGESQGHGSERDTAVWKSIRARIRKSQGDHDGALLDANSAIAWYMGQMPVDERGLAHGRATRASILFALGNLTGALEDITFAIECFMRESPPDERQLALFRAIRAEIRYGATDLVGALDDITLTIDWSDRQGSGDDRSIAYSHVIRARIRLSLGNLSGAINDITFAVDWAQRRTPLDMRSIAVARSERASFRHAAGDLAGALIDINFSIDWARGQMPVDEQNVVIWRATRSGIRQDQGDVLGALEDIDSSINWGERQTHRDERGIAIDRFRRARIRQIQGNFVEALEDINSTIDWIRRQTPWDLRNIAASRETEAIILAKLGNFSGAGAAIDETVDIYSRLFGMDHKCTTNAVAFQRSIYAGRAPNGEREKPSNYLMS